MCPSVRVCVCDGCGRGLNEFAGRVQNHHVRFSFHRNGQSLVKAAACLDTLRYRLREGCHCGRLPLHYSDGQEHKIIWILDQNENKFSLKCLSVQGARQPLSPRAISLGSFTVWLQGTSCSSSFVSKVLGANYNMYRANNFYPVADKFAMCTDRK